MIDKEVSDLYLSGLSGREVATEIGLSKTKICEIILRLGISRDRRTREKVLLSKVAKCKPLADNFVSYLDGLLISDGCLYSRSKIIKTAFYSQTSVHKKWLLEIKHKFKQQGIESRLRKEVRPQYKSGCAWNLVSGSYCELYQQYQRWYRGAKRVPRDLLIDGPMMKNWIYGDGTLLKNSTLRLCTDSFTVAEIGYLINSLSHKFGVSLKTVFMGLSKEKQPKYRISLCKSGGLLSLYHQIGEPINCFKYKWRT